MAGHCIRHPELSVHQFIIWETTQGKANIGRRRLNYVDMLRIYTRLLDKQEIRTSMLEHIHQIYIERDVWRQLSNTDDRVEDQQGHP